MSRWRNMAAAAAFFFWMASPNIGSAQEPPSVWTYSLYKTITYELAANLADIPLYYTVLGGGTALGAGWFTVVNIATAAGAYYTHEVAWNLYGPSMQESPETALEVGLEKTIVYRVVSSARNIVLAYLVTGSPGAVVSFVIINNVVDAVIYVANEYGWYTYGPAVAPQSAPSPARSAAVPVPAPVRNFARNFVQLVQRQLD